MPGARNLMRGQLRLIAANERGVIAGQVLPLHDIRVAIRRLRVLLSAADAPADLERRWKRLSDRLGPARDLDTWLRFLRNPKVEKRMRRRPGWDLFLAGQARGLAAKKVGVRRVLRGKPYARLKSDTAAFLRSGAGARIPVAELRRELRRMDRREEAARGLPTEPAHRLRIACRRARYLAEFLAAHRGRAMAELARRLKTVQDVLGDVHDLDVRLAHLKAARPRAPSALAAHLRRLRRKAAGRFAKAWSRLRKAHRSKAVRRALKA